jgi:predicted kinase
MKQGPDEELNEGREPTVEEIKRVEEEYISTLKLPASKPSPQWILCPVGLVGSGKTTILRRLSERLNLLQLRADDVRVILKKYGLAYAATETIVVHLVDTFLNEGCSIAMDNDCVGRAKELIERAVDRHHVQAIWIHINPPESFILDAIRHRETMEIFGSVENALANYERRKPLHEHLDMPFVYTFDPSREDFDKQMNEVVSKIEEAIKRQP